MWAFLGHKEESLKKEDCTWLEELLKYDASENWVEDVLAGIILSLNGLMSGVTARVASTPWFSNKHRLSSKTCFYTLRRLKYVIQLNCSVLL